MTDSADAAPGASDERPPAPKFLIAVCDATGRYLRAEQVEQVPEGALVLPPYHDLDGHRDAGNAPRWGGEFWVFDRKDTGDAAALEQPAVAFAFADLIDALAAAGIVIPAGTAAWRQWFATTVDSSAGVQK